YRFWQRLSVGRVVLPEQFVHSGCRLQMLFHNLLKSGIYRPLFYRKYIGYTGCCVSRKVLWTVPSNPMLWQYYFQVGCRAQYCLKWWRLKLDFFAEDWCPMLPQNTLTPYYDCLD